MKKNKEDISLYEGLITVFALILVVEFGSGVYDSWDLLLAVIAVFIGLKYKVVAIELNDDFYTFLTSCLISLGLISLVLSILGWCSDIEHTMLRLNRPTENLRFLVFLATTIYIFLRIKITSRKNSANLETKATIDSA